MKDASTQSVRDNELQKLKRVELLKMLVALSQENERLGAENEELKKQLADRAIRIEGAGSIADASLQVSGVFSAAQEAADRYLENIARMDAEAQARAGEMLARAQAECDAMREQAARDVEAQRANLQAWTDRYAAAEQSLNAKLDSLSGQYPEQAWRSQVQDDRGSGKVTDIGRSVG